MDEKNKYNFKKWNRKSSKWKWEKIKHLESELY